MEINKDTIVINATQLAPDQYATTMTISEIANLANSGRFVYRDNNDQKGYWINTNAREIAMIISGGKYFYDNISLAIIKDHGTITFDGSNIRITGTVYAVDGDRRIKACQSLQFVNKNPEILCNRFIITIYYIDSAELDRIATQFEHSVKKRSHKVMIERSKRIPLAITESINSDAGADMAYAGRITDKPDAVFGRTAIVNCITEFFPNGYGEESQNDALVRYLVKFLNIVVEFYGDDFADPSSSVNAGRFITNIYGTYLMMIFASWTFPIYRNDEAKWRAVINDGLKRIDVYDRELCAVSIRKTRKDIVDMRLQGLVKGALKARSLDSATEYLNEVTRDVDNNSMVSEGRKRNRMITVRGMLDALSKSEESHGAKIIGCDDKMAVSIINDVVTSFSRGYAYMIEVELKKYLMWLTNNKGVRFSDVVMRACGDWRSNNTNTERLYFASIEDLRATLDDLIPIYDYPTQRDYDRIIAQLVFFGFKIEEATMLPYDSLKGNIISAYDKEVWIDDDLKLSILRYRMESIRYSDDDDINRCRRYPINHRAALMSLNKSVSSSAATNCRKRFAGYSNEDRKLSCNEIWYSGVYSRMISDGTTIDHVTHTVLGRYNQADFDLYKQTFYAK